MTDESGVKAMWDAIPADIGIPKDVMDKARVALAYAMTQASEGDTDAAIAIIGKAIMAERERCARICEVRASEFKALSRDPLCITDPRWHSQREAQVDMRARSQAYQFSAEMIRRGDA